MHEQSYFKMKTFFTETRELHPVVYDDMDHSANGYIHPGEILFVNWESINKDNALMIRDTEQSASLYDLTRRTQTEHEIPLVVIIDEEHMFGGRQAKKSEKVLQNIMPKLESGMFATGFVDGIDDLRGIPGLIEMTSDWAAGVEFHNDENLTGGIRYLDLVTVTDNTTGKFEIYQCRLAN